MKKFTKLVAVVIFGVVFPVALLIQAYSNTAALAGDVSYSTSIEELSQQVDDAKGSNWDVNSYALFSLLYVEHANLTTMINKQQMKTTVVSIGFAVISVGIMMIILGISGGKSSGLEASAKLQDVQFDFKTGSTGVAIFVIGAIMATLGGVLKNDYQTSAIPSYSQQSSSIRSAQELDGLDAFRHCKDNAESFETCFSQIYFQIYEGSLK